MEAVVDASGALPGRLLVVIALCLLLVDRVVRCRPDRSGVSAITP